MATHTKSRQRFSQVRLVRRAAPTRCQIASFSIDPDQRMYECPRCAHEVIEIVRLRKANWCELKHMIVN